MAQEIENRDAQIRRKTDEYEQVCLFRSFNNSKYKIIIKAS